MLIIPFFSMSQVKPKLVYNDLQKMNMKGKVKQVFEHDSRNMNSEMVETKQKNFYQFLSNGKLKRKVNFVTRTIVDYTYDRKGRLLIQKSKSPYNEQILNYSYPKDSLVITKTAEGDYISISKNVIKKNNETEILKISDTTQYKGSYTYDKYYRTIKSEGLHYYPSKMDTVKITAVYYKKCLMPIVQSFKSPFFKNILNDRCDIILHTIIKNDGTISEKSEYSYVYDKKKNWIERKTYVGGKLSHSTIRKIKYY